MPAKLTRGLGGNSRVKACGKTSLRRLLENPLTVAAPIPLVLFYQNIQISQDFELPREERSPPAA